MINKLCINKKKSKIKKKIWKKQKHQKTEREWNGFFLERKTPVLPTLPASRPSLFSTISYLYSDNVCLVFEPRMICQISGNVCPVVTLITRVLETSAQLLQIRLQIWVHSLQNRRWIPWIPPIQYFTKTRIHCTATTTLPNKNTAGDTAGNFLWYRNTDNQLFHLPLPLLPGR